MGVRLAFELFSSAFVDLFFFYFLVYREGEHNRLHAFEQALIWASYSNGAKSKQSREVHIDQLRARRANVLIAREI